MLAGYPRNEPCVMHGSQPEQTQELSKENPRPNAPEQIVMTLRHADVMLAADKRVRRIAASASHQYGTKVARVTVSTVVPSVPVTVIKRPS